MSEPLDAFDHYRDAGRHGAGEDRPGQRTIPVVTDGGRVIPLTLAIIRRAATRRKRFVLAQTAGGTPLLVSRNEIERAIGPEVLL